jgi:hypothetical protein
VPKLEIPSVTTLVAMTWPVALVLLEPILLYAGYGVLTRAAARHVERALRAD